MRTLGVSAALSSHLQSKISLKLPVTPTGILEVGHFESSSRGLFPYILWVSARRCREAFGNGPCLQPPLNVSGLGDPVSEPLQQWTTPRVTCQAGF